MVNETAGSSHARPSGGIARARRYAGLLAVLAILGAVAKLRAQDCHNTQHVDLCDLKAGMSVRGLAPVKIALGCRLAGCCLDCNLADPFSLRVWIEESPLGEAKLAFPTLTSEELDVLKSSRGEIDREAKTLTLGPGETIIEGIRIADNRPPPIVEFVPAFDRETLLARVPPSGLSLGVVLEQSIGKTIINKSDWAYRFDPCPEPPASSATIVLSGNSNGDRAVILLDYYIPAGPPDCPNDRLLGAIDKACVDPLVSGPGCQSELTVLSSDNALKFEPNASVAAGATHVVTLGPLIVVPLNVWVARDYGIAIAVKQVATANMLYDKNRVGVWFDADTGGHIKTVSLAETEAANCNDPTLYEPPAKYQSDQLNVYIKPQSGTAGGFTCGADRNVIYISAGLDADDMLAHEIGHAFGLFGGADDGHVNGLGFHCKNIMQEAGFARKFFTIGQAYRMNLHDESKLNKNGHRTDPSRPCPLTVTSSQQCPALSTDPGPPLSGP